MLNESGVGGVSSRRTWLLMVSSMLAAIATPSFAQTRVSPKLQMRRNPGCGCCEGWADHMRKAGFEIEMEDDPDLTAYKNSLGIPKELHGCHTSVGETHIFEGHIPAPTVQRFLRERPKAKGLAVAGMPAGSPGMESSSPVAYDVIAFDGESSWVYDKITP